MMKARLASIEIVGRNAQQELNATFECYQFGEYKRQWNRDKAVWVAHTHLMTKLQVTALVDYVSYIGKYNGLRIDYVAESREYLRFMLGENRICNVPMCASHKGENLYLIPTALFAYLPQNAERLQLRASHCTLLGRRFKRAS